MATKLLIDWTGAFRIFRQQVKPTHVIGFPFLSRIEKVNDETGIFRSRVVLLQCAEIKPAENDIYMLAIAESHDHRCRSTNIVWRKLRACEGVPPFVVQNCLL